MYDHKPAINGIWTYNYENHMKKDWSKWISIAVNIIVLVTLAYGILSAKSDTKQDYLEQQLHRLEQTYREDLKEMKSDIKELRRLILDLKD